MKKTKWLALVSLAVLLGCQTARIPVPKASPPAEASADAAAKQFVPAAGKGNLYVARNQESFYDGEPFMVAVDGKLIGYLAPGMFFLVSVDPGPHQVSVSSLAGFDKVEGSIKADKDYFYTISKSSSDGGKPSIGIVLFDALGKMAVKQSSLAQGANP